MIPITEGVENGHSHIWLAGIKQIQLFDRVI